MNFGVDLDGVIANWCESFIDYYNFNYKKNISLKEINQYNLWDCPLGLTREVSLRIMGDFYESGWFDKIELVSGAREALLELAKANKLFLITSRPLAFNLKTEIFLEKTLLEIPISVFYSHAFNEDKIKSIGNLKLDICKRLEIDYFVEDCLEYAVDCERVCRGVFLINYPWNCGPVNGNIMRVNNWNEILGKLKEFEYQNIGGGNGNS